jgi:hypothetical protein
LATSPVVTHPDRSTRRPCDFLAPGTESDDEQNHHDDGNDEGGDAIVRVLMESPGR